MRRGHAIRNLLLIALAVLVCGMGFWQMLRTPTVKLNQSLSTSVETTAEQLNQCLAQPVEKVVERLRLADGKWDWLDEPPGILRGVTYYQGDGREVKLYIASGEPLFRKFSDSREWDYIAFLQCRVGGIQYTAGAVHHDIGPAVPWQFRQP